MRSSPAPRLLPALAALSALAPAGAVDLAAQLLSLDQFEEVRRSESPADFGGLPSQGETDKLWSDAAMFEYEVAMSHSSEHAASSPGYHPYLVCSTYPGLSGQAREEKVNSMFQNTPGVSASDFYADGNLFHNTEEMSCGVLRAYNDTISEVYAANPEAAGSMTVNPLHPSMKMTQNTVETLESWFDEGADAGGAVSISVGGVDVGGGDTIQVKVPGLHMVLCPGVQEFGGDDVPNQQVAEDVKGFVMANGGEIVEELSFYHHRVSGADGEDAPYTDRMDQWAGAVTAVRGWNNVVGNNPCLDRVIGDSMKFVADGKMLVVNAEMSFWEGTEIAQSLGMEEGNVAVCIRYMVHALALSPMVCSLEPKTRVKTLCKDGSSDLTKCAGGGGESGGGGDDLDEGDESSGGTVGRHAWRNNVAWSIALLVWWSARGCVAAKAER